MRHLFKLDPAKANTEALIQRLAEAGTDGFIIGGTDDIEAEQVHTLYQWADKTALPIFMEISEEAFIVGAADHFLVPLVLNTTNIAWFGGKHQEVIKTYHPYMPWSKIWTEGYVILNPEAKAAKHADANTDLTYDDVAAYALMAEKLFALNILYIEYSGTYGDAALVQHAKRFLKQTKLWYGGGIRNREQALEMAAVADTIIVGNVIYEDVEEAIQTAKLFADKSVTNSETI